MADDLPKALPASGLRAALTPRPATPDRGGAAAALGLRHMVLIDAADGVRAYRDLVVAEANLGPQASRRPPRAAW